MKILLHRNNASIAENAREANGFLARLVGLLGRSGFDDFDALILPRCKAVHMWGMRFAIDVLFCSEALEVVGVVENLRPWSMSPYFHKSSIAIECPQGTIRRCKPEVGDMISVFK